MINREFKVGDKVRLVEERLSDRATSKRIAKELRDKILIISTISHDFDNTYLRFEDADHSDIGGIASRLFDKIDDVINTRKSKIENLNI